MQLWFARASEVTLREQLVTQIILAIASGDLSPGQRLPSTRDLARRFRLHPNTVSAGYRHLERERWVEFRRGSGVYVCQSLPEGSESPSLALDRLVLHLIRSARELGLSLATIRSRLRHWIELQPPDHFVLIEPDEDLRRILAFEMQSALTLNVLATGLDNPALPRMLDGAIPVVQTAKARLARAAVKGAAELFQLQFRSVPTSLASYLPVPSTALVGIASGWPSFLKHARTILLAAGLHSDGLLIRDTRRPNWRRGLDEASAVVCDSLTASQLPKSLRTIAFQLLSETSVAELKRYEEFLRNPFAPES